MSHIVFISDWETRGGAAIAASRLAQSLVMAGHQLSRLVVFPAAGPQPWSTQRLVPPLLLLRRAVRRALAPGPRERWDRLAVPVVQRRLQRLLAQLRPDVIHLHNLHGGIGAGWSPELLRICTAYAPTVWTLHDMWGLTGRCVYSRECRKFLSGCDASCPTASEYPALAPQRVAHGWAQRQRILAACPNLVAVAPSRWLAEQARAGLWARHRVEWIPNGVPLHIYQLSERQAARQALGIADDGPLVLVTAPQLNDPRKGGTLLAQVLAHVADTSFALALMGAGELALDAAAIRVHRLGYIADESRKALAYSAADLLLHLAPQDNLPNTVLEALACGTPVVAFATGGVPEMVRPGQTGWLATDLTGAALAHTLRLALQELAQGGDWRQRCRAIAEAEYDVVLQANRHLALYQSLRG